MNHISLSEHFFLDEFACPCCRRVMLCEYLFSRIVLLRNTLGKPIYITSAYRCPKYNARVKGDSNSYHMKGLAVDIVVHDIPLPELYIIAKELGFTGIGIYPQKNFLHLDVRPGSYTEWRG